MSYYVTRPEKPKLKSINIIATLMQYRYTVMEQLYVDGQVCMVFLVLSSLKNL